MSQTPSAGTARILCFTSLLVGGGALLMTCPSVPAQETRPVGKTLEDQQRNAVLLGDYDYTKYSMSFTGYTGQDRQRVAFLSWQHAVRTRVGPRGSYKAGLTILPEGRLVLAACRSNNDPDPTKRRFVISVYESADQGLTWQDIGKTPLLGKEPSLTALPDGSLVLSAQKDYFGPGAKLDEIYISRSPDGGRTWDTQILPGGDYPRNMIIEPDGTLLMIRALATGGITSKGSPNLQLCRSKDGGKTWQFSEGIVDWDYSQFAEVSAIRFKSGRLLAALRRQIPGTRGHGFEDTVLTESSDEGKHWSKPRDMVNTAEVHVYLTELKDGRVLATYSNYHLPWGVYAIVSKDEGKSWDLDHPIQLALSADHYNGWPVTLQLADGSLITSYAITAYLKQPPETTVTEVVRWKMPAVDLAVVKDNAVAGCQGPTHDGERTDHPGSRVDQALSRMTLDEKVGMLLMVQLDKATLEPFLRDFHCGSLLVWGNINPIHDAAELCALANQAQGLSLKHRSLPVWLHGWAPGLGWEPDWISRAARRVGPEEVRQAAAVFGRRWRAVGLHNLPQPCLNVPLHPTGIMLDWAISTDPEVVSRYGLALTRGVLSAGCGTMAQHFPAHGAAALDSHTAFPVVDLPADELWRDHLACYQACFDAGCTTLCTAHLACLALDPDRTQIATTSRRVLTDFLRGKMGFRGIAIADALEMRGFRKNGPLEQVAVDAVIAGCDSLCIVEPENVQPVFTHLLQAARQGKITPERLNEAVKRNLEFMAWLGLFEDPMVSAEDALKLLENEADNALLRKVTGRSEPEAITTTEQDPPQTAPSAPATTRFGISADAHLMKSAPPEHEAFFRRFVDAMVGWKPDFVIDLGDFACQCPGGKTTPAMHDCQLEGLKRHFALWGPLPGPYHHVLGNHDVGWIMGGEETITPRDLYEHDHRGEDITKDEFLAVTGTPSRYYSFDVKGYHFIVLDGNNRRDDSSTPAGRDGVEGTYWIDAAQKAWLARDLAANRRKLKLVFSHEELHHTPVEGSREGGDRPFPRVGKEVSYIDNGWQIREMLRTDGRVLACFAGHKHRSRWTVHGGVNYITLSAVHWGGSYAKVTLSDKLCIEGVGNQRSYTLTMEGPWPGGDVGESNQVPLAFPFHKKEPVQCASQERIVGGS